MMQIATVKNDKPWVATVWFVNDDNFNLYFTSRKTRRHSLEIKNNKNVAGVIVLPHETLGVKCRGIQFEGEAFEVSLRELPRAFSIYLKRYPKATIHIKSIQQIISNATEQRVYKIVPRRIVLFDEINFPDNPRQEFVVEK